MSGELTFHHLDVINPSVHSPAHPFPPQLTHLCIQQHSQSQRILWLLEELSLAYPTTFRYKLIHHFRTSSKLAPSSLKAVSPTGKAPALILPSGRALNESTTIATYLLKTYDVDGHFGGGNRMYNSHVSDAEEQDDWLRDDELTSFASSSLGFLVQFVFVLQIIPKLSPWFIRPVMTLLFKGVILGIKPRLKGAMRFVEGKLGDQEWFGGERPGRADFVMEFPVSQVLQRGMVGQGEFGEIRKWRERVEASEGWKRGLSKGNGYDWTGM